jgi:chromosome segregation ATPase
MSTDLTDNPTSQVVAFSPSEAAIAQLARDYLPLKTCGLEDKEAYETVRKARIHVKTLRVEIEKRRKTLNSDALAWQKKVNAAAKQLTSLLEPIETHLLQQEGDFERLKEEKRTAEARAREAEYQAKRKAELEELAREKAELDRQRAEIEAERQKQAAALKAQQDAIDADRRKQEEAAAAERRRLADMAKARQDELDAREAEQRARLKAEQDKIDAANRLREQQAAAAAKIEADRLHAIEVERARQEAAEKARIETEERLAWEAEQRSERERLAEAARIKAESLRPARDRILAIAETLSHIDVPAGSIGCQDEQFAYDSVVLEIGRAVEAIRKIAESLVVVNIVDDDDIPF